MQEENRPHKKRTSKYQPKNLTILHEDRDIIVVDKSAGLLTIGTAKEKQQTAHFILNDYVKKGNERSKNRIYIVHRLDRDTSGVLIFAKSESAKKYLQDNWHDFSKKYFTVVHGNLKDKEGEISSYLFENKIFRVYSTKDPEKGKFSKTGYKVIRESEEYSLLEIYLFTGRKNQIRVHLSDLGHPVVGDKIYGSTAKGLKRMALHSASLTITHPFTKKEMSFSTKIPNYFKTLV